MIVISNINWAELQQAAGEAGFDAVPAGMYDVIVDTASTKAASSGKNMIVVRFKIENGPEAGKSVFNQFVLSPENANALAFFFRHMAAMGLSEAYFQSNPPLERVAADLTGRRCRIQVSIREWNGSDRNNVDSVAPPAGGPAAAPTLPPPGLGHFSAAPSVTPGVTAPSGAPAVPSIPGVPPITPAASKPAAPAAPAVPATTPPPPPAFDEEMPF